MSTWRRVDAAPTQRGDLAALLEALSVPAVGIAAWVRNSDTGSLAVIVDWAAVTGSGRGEARLAKSSAEPRRLALATGDSLEQAPGLLRHGDVVGVLRGSGVHAPSPLAGLARHGELIVHGGDGKPLRVDLFGAAAVDRGQLTAGAPVDLKDPEDLDAREDWFKKRHEGDGD